jgi:hypothetical protein
MKPRRSPRRAHPQSMARSAARAQRPGGSAGGEAEPRRDYTRDAEQGKPVSGDAFTDRSRPRLGTLGVGGVTGAPRTLPSQGFSARRWSPLPIGKGRGTGKNVPPQRERV